MNGSRMMEIKDDLEAIKEHLEECAEELRSVYGELLSCAMSERDIQACRRLYAVLKKMERMV